MRVFTKVRAAVLGIAVVLGTLGGVVALEATPVAAGVGFWSHTACYGGYPVYSNYYAPGGNNHQGTYANVYIDPASFPIYLDGRNLGTVGVNNHLGAGGAYIWDLYSQLGFECGWAGVPVSTAYSANNNDGLGVYYYQYFIKPGTCDLRYLVAYENNGPVGAAYVPHFYC